MTTTITGAFTSMDTIRNTMDDLLACGIDREKIFADSENNELKVMIPDDIEIEVTKIIQRHKPFDMVTHHR
jgi:tryptophanyl-tRNA synthetase